MKHAALFLSCLAILLVAPLALAATNTAPAVPSLSLVDAGSGDPYLSLSEISTEAYSVKECQIVDHGTCGGGSHQGQDCAPEFPGNCHCIVTPIHLCVQNP